MNRQQKAFHYALRVFLAFKKQNTPGADEYARRIRKALFCIHRGEFESAQKLIDLCYVDNR